MQAVEGQAVLLSLAIIPFPLPGKDLRHLPRYRPSS